MRVRVSMLLKSRASLKCFRACFHPGQAKDLSATRYDIQGVCFVNEISFSSIKFIFKIITISVEMQSFSTITGMKRTKTLDLSSCVCVCGGGWGGL